MLAARTNRDPRWSGASGAWLPLVWLRPVWLRLLGCLLASALLPMQTARPQPAPTDWSVFSTQSELPPDMPTGAQLNVIRGDYPHLTVNAIPQHLLAWDVGMNLSAAPNDLRAGVETSRALDLPVVILRVDLPSLSINPKRNELKRVQDLVNVADNLNRQFILALELDWAPEWYVRQGLTTVMEASSANLNQDRAMGLSGQITGPVRNPEHGAMVAASDERYLDLCRTFIADLHNLFRNHPRFIGWVITPPSAPLCYPGLGRDGVGGFADYTATTVAQFDPSLDFWALMEAREQTLSHRDIFASGGAFQGIMPSSSLEEQAAPVFEPESTESETADPATDPAADADTPPSSEGAIPAPDSDAGIAPISDEERNYPNTVPPPYDPIIEEAAPPVIDPSIETGLPGTVVEAAPDATGEEPGTLVGFRNAPPEPLPPGSKNGPDDRPVWRKWSQFRVYELQLRFDALVTKLRSLDQQHPIFATAWGSLAYRDHNGYEALAAGLDPVWVARHPMVDGLVIPFALSSRTFDLPSGAGDADNLNSLRAMSRLAQRYNKLSVVSVEKSPTNPPRAVDIATLQQWCVASGTDPWWSSNGFFTQRSFWSLDDQEEIARGAPYKVLPFPSRRMTAPVTILDSPILCANSYADLSPRMSRATHIADILTACGVDFEVIFPQEFPTTGGPRPELGKVTYLIHNDLVTTYDPYTVGFQTAVAKLNTERKKAGLGAYPLSYLDDVAANTWYLNGYASRPLRESFLRELHRSGIRSKLRNGPPSLMVMNDTYVFYRALRSGPGRAPELFLLDTQDPARIKPLASIDYINLNTNKSMSLQLNNGFVDFSLLPNTPGEGPVLLGRPTALGPARLVYAQAARSVVHNQHSAAMRRSLPWILLLSLAAIALGLLYVYQLNVSRKGGIRLYLLRRQQAALVAALHGKSSVTTVGGANSVRRFQASGIARTNQEPHIPLTDSLDSDAPADTPPAPEEFPY